MECSSSHHFSVNCYKTDVTVGSSSILYLCLVLSILTYKILLLITNDSVLAQLIRWFETETKRYFYKVLYSQLVTVPTCPYLYSHSLSFSFLPLRSSLFLLVLRSFSFRTMFMELLREYLQMFQLQEY